MKGNMLNRSEEVNQFIDKLEHPLKAEIEQVRAIILGLDDQITEHIKWNAPSFCYEGEDRLTFNLHSKDQLLLVFHRGAKKRQDNDFKFEDSTGLLKWASNDRATLTLGDMEDVEAKQPALEAIVRKWMKSTEG